MLSGKGVGFEYIGFCILVDAVMPWQKIDKLMKFDCEVINYIDAQ